MARKYSLIAAASIVGMAAGTAFTLDAGRPLDADAKKKLGLDDGEIERLKNNGALVEAGEFEPVSELPPGQTAPGTTGTEFEGMSLDAMHAFLDEHKIKYPKDASAPDLMKIALEHQKPTPTPTPTSSPAAGAATETDPAKIAKSTPKADIKAELDKLQIPYAADADEAVLADLLGKARAGKSA